MVCCLVVRSQRRQTEESPVCDINDMERWRLERGLHALTPPSPLSSSPVSSPLLLLPSPFLSPFHLFHLVSSTSHIFHYTSTPPRRSLYCLSLLTHSASWLPVPDSCFSQCCLCVKGRLRAQRRRGGWGQGLGSKKQNKNSGIL